MAQSSGPDPSAPATQRLNRRRLWIALGILGGVLYVGFQALSGAAALYLSSPSLFQSKTPVAPSGWRNVTPPGQATSYSYAVSADAPVLILACGATLSTSPTSFGKWSMRLLRSDDGGAHWRALQAPFLKGADDCGITPIAGSPTTFFAFGRRLLGGSPTPASFWVTHDAGETWTLAFTAQRDYDEYDVTRELSSSVLRDGVLYGLHGDAYASGPVFSSSADDGATWTPLLTKGGAAVVEDHVTSVAPDYAHPHAWYQVVTPEIEPVMLEHSSDDGKTWTPVAQFPRAGAVPSELATSPAHPTKLCAYDFEADSQSSGSLIAGDATIFSSGDSGVTWRQAALPLRNGDTFGPVRIGPDGCYLAFQEENKGGLLGLAHNVSIWRLPAESSSAEQVVLVKSYRFTYATYMPGFTYAHAASGMEARFIIAATREPGSLLDFLGGNASNLTAPQLLWTPAPS